MKILLAISLVGVAFALGLIAPDIDQKVGFLLHRSALTHGPWLALAAGFLSIRSTKGYLMPLLGMAFSIALAVHFAADLFPKEWTGFALIHLPLYGRIPAAASVLWLVMSLVVSTGAAGYMGWRCLPKEDY